MVALVIGGSGSGKSAWAEELACSLRAREGGPLLYLAAMDPAGEEGRRRVERHRALRAGKGFLTLERPLGPGREEIPPGLPPALFLGTAWEAGLRRFPLELSLRECRIGGRRAGMEDAAALILLGRRETEEEKGGTPGKNGGAEPALLP